MTDRRSAPRCFGVGPRAPVRHFRPASCAPPPEGQTRYAAMLREFTRRAHRRELAGSSPDVVAVAGQHALTARRPRTRVPVGKDARILTILPRILPDRLLDRLRIRTFGMPKTWH